jgi:hypothetical protein
VHIDACQTNILSRSCHGARPLAQVRMSAGGHHEAGPGDCVADSDKAAGGPGRGTAAASIGPHARVDPGARRRPWRLHGFSAHDGPRRPSMAGLRAPAQPTLGAWRPGGLLPLGVMHGVSELVIAMPAIDIRTRLLRDAKRGHERAGILARRGGIVDGLSCGRHHDPLLSSWRTWGKGVDRTCADGEGTANVPQHTRDGLRVREHGARSRSGRARPRAAPRQLAAPDGAHDAGSRSWAALTVCALRASQSLPC